MSGPEAVTHFVACVSPGSVSRTTSGLQGDSLANDLIDDPCAFQNTKFTFPSGSQWRILEPLSPIRFQISRSPCEATQVFAARRIKGTPAHDSEHEEAVIKIKFQIRAPSETLKYHQDWIDYAEEDLDDWSELSAQEQEAVEDARESFRSCTRPTTTLSEEVMCEVDALQRLADVKCRHAPWLLDVMQQRTQAGTHPREIVGGYLTLTVMTKVPGTCLSYKYVSGLSCADRDRLREDFKEALTDVWGAGVQPVDPALRNLIWDREARVW
ncbi:hypothetical protein NX059_009353 [Plenodomus lindquistii]|nr:hypothetical protein NX059_009353 [Plenodomus lindquistii]